MKNKLLKLYKYADIKPRYSYEVADLAYEGKSHTYMVFKEDLVNKKELFKLRFKVVEVHKEFPVLTEKKQLELLQLMATQLGSYAALGSELDYNHRNNSLDDMLVETVIDFWALIRPEIKNQIREVLK